MKATWVPDEPMSIPTLRSRTLSCCQMGLFSNGSGASWSGS
ncbi:MAG TPA: hypothetical protein VFR23_23505 [Jiangellaceae bacterium]|nr:hypothetical protein [Jiangellaceae bacterium]